MEVRGWVLSDNSGYICRRFLITYENRLIPLSDIYFIHRNKPQHQRVLKSVENNLQVKSMFGVSGPSPLHDLHNFNSTHSLPADSMHDFFEGNYYK